MSQRFDIKLTKNEAYQATFDYYDSLGQAIPLSTVSGDTKMSVRNVNDNSSTPVVTINTSTDDISALLTTPKFFFPPEATNRFMLYIPQAFLVDASTGFSQPNVASTLYYDIVVKRLASTNTVTKTISGSNGQPTITVSPDNTGLYKYMSVTGTNIGAAAKISVVNGTTITLTVNNSGTVSGTGTFVQTVSPSIVDTIVSGRISLSSGVTA
mgnify:CR=1 FL=1